MENKYFVRYETLTTLTKWLNAHFGEKKTGENFTIADTQQYINRGYLPAYLGGHKIEKEHTVTSINLYKIKQ